MANDLEMLKIALDGGASAKNITSRYDGTALIAAAHLGHAEAVKLLIAAKAPLNHVNNLGWTALMEAIVLGNGGAQPQATLKAWSRPARTSIFADRHRITPLQHARQRGLRGDGAHPRSRGRALGTRLPLTAPPAIANDAAGTPRDDCAKTRTQSRAL